MGLCKECKNFIKASFNDEQNQARFSKCRRTLDPLHASNFVGHQPDGEDMKFCSMERMHGWLDARIFKTCGREGRYFEPK